MDVNKNERLSNFTLRYLNKEQDFNFMQTELLPPGLYLVDT